MNLFCTYLISIFSVEMAWVDKHSASSISTRLMMVWLVCHSVPAVLLSCWWRASTSTRLLVAWLLSHSGAFIPFGPWWMSFYSTQPLMAWPVSHLGATIPLGWLRMRLHSTRLMLEWLENYSVFVAEVVSPSASGLFSLQHIPMFTFSSFFLFCRGIYAVPTFLTFST